jgi:hypothetical protein
MAGNSRQSNAPLSIRQLMSDSGSGFGKLLKRAKAISQLDRRVSRLLDPELARFCQVANLRDGRLILACSSPGCATRLRMQANSLLDQLHAAGLQEIEAIEVKMMPERPSAMDGARKTNARR